MRLSLQSAASMDRQSAWNILGKEEGGERRQVMEGGGGWGGIGGGTVTINTLV